MMSGEPRAPVSIIRKGNCRNRRLRATVIRFPEMGVEMNRREFAVAATVTAASLISARGTGAATTPVNARNVVLVHGLFADGSSWSEVIARLQSAGLNVRRCKIL